MKGKRENEEFKDNENAANKESMMVKRADPESKSKENKANKGRMKGKREMKSLKIMRMWQTKSL